MASRKHAVSPGAAAPSRSRAPRQAVTAGRKPFPIVGIGASAGGLEAFEQLLRHMPVDTGMGLVLVQHLDPTHASMLVEILQRVTSLPVVEARDQMQVVPDRVHVIPPNRDMALSKGRLQLTVPAEPRGLRMPIDDFFQSLAADQAQHASGIVLSGTGTDGTLGLRAIFDVGGLCLVQEPATAKFDSMPVSAIKAGCASRVLPVDKMPQALLDGNRTPFVQGAAAEAGVAAPSKDGIGRILAQLQSASGHDFSQYKKSTIGRRIDRRVAQLNIRDLQTYARYLKEHPGEVQPLFRELLINVTGFFRDAEAFATLKRKVIPMLLEGKPDDHVLRIWVAGCATGEEVYSVAIVVREWMEEAQREIQVQLYGTDLDDDAIKQARSGLFPPEIAAAVGPDRLQRFFTEEATGYRVTKELRDMTVFAVQSIIKDPPFTRLDLLCCRNVLIYLEPELQDRLIPSFHYALNPGGVLFLSPSESIGKHLDLFEVIDRKWKFYRSKALLVSARKLLSEKLSWVADRTAPLVAAGSHRSGGRHFADLAKRALLQSYAPAAVVTDLHGTILYVHGDTGPYLRPAPGEPTHNVVEMAREGLQLALREALRVAATQGLAAASRPTLLSSHGERRPVDLIVRPLADPDGAQSVLLVSFQSIADAAEPAPARKSRGRLSAEAQRCVELERELVHIKESLRGMLEEQQISNEELKSTNEEIQSTNEELQSTNEELETSKEELQSVNEELVTVNSELQTKIEQMANMQDDMKNLLDNLQLGVVFLDLQLKIRRFTRDAIKVFRLVASDIGRPLADIRSEFIGPDLLVDAQVVLDSLVPTEREARTPQGQWYLVRIQPYRTVDNVIEGVVLTFADVTERVGAIAAQEALSLAEAIVDAVASPLVVLDGKRRVMSANRAFYEQFPGKPQDTVGVDILAIGKGRWDVPAVRELLERPWPAKSGIEVRQIEAEFPGADAPRYTLGARRVLSQPLEREVVLLSISPASASASAGPLAGPVSRRKRPGRGA